MNGSHETSLWRLTKCSLKGWIDDRAPTMGAALAFYALLSLAPLLLVVIALAGLIVGRDQAQAALHEQLAYYMGDALARVVEGVVRAAGTRKEGAIAAAAGTLMLLVGATTVFGELRRDLDTIWRHRSDEGGGIGKLARARLKAFAMVAGAGFMLLLSMLASTWANAMSEWLAWLPAVTIAIDFAVSFLVVTALFAMIYKILPGARIEWDDVWVGAAVTAALFWVGKFLIALYLARSDVGSGFGAAGATVALLVWIYYSAQIFFLGAEFTRHYALQYGSRRDEPMERRRSPTPPTSPAVDDALIERAQRVVRELRPMLERRKRPDFPPG